MMRYILLLIASIISITFCGCTETKEAEVTETTTETSAADLNEYLLTRGWNADELLSSIYYCGEFHPLPMRIEDYSEFILSDGVLYFSASAYAKATTDENGTITSLEFSADSAPHDFSVYGVDFNAHPYDIQEKIGFATSVIGDEETTIIFGFDGGGINQLLFEFNEKKLVSVYISA